MKHTRSMRLLSLLLAVAMLCSLGMTALATEGTEPDPAPIADPNPSPSVTLSAPDVAHGGGEDPVTVTANVTTNAPEGWDAQVTDYSWTGAAGLGTTAAVIISETTTVSCTATVKYTKEGETDITKTASGSKTIKVGYNVSTTNGTGYTVTATPSELVEVGTTVNVTVAAANGYRLNEYNVDPGESFAMPSHDVNVTVSGKNGAPVATQKSLTVNYTLLPEEGITVSAPAAQTVNYGSGVTFPALSTEVGNTEYTVEWFIGGTTKATSLTAAQVNAYIDAGTESISIVGQWVEQESDTFTVQLPTVANAEVNLTSTGTGENGTYKAGETVTFTVEPKDGYKFSGSGVITDTRGNRAAATSTGTGSRSFSYVVNADAATNGVITLTAANLVEAVTVTITFNMNTTNSGKLTRAGTATPATIAARTIKYDALSNLTPTTSGRLVAYDGGATYELKGWSAGTRTFGMTITKAELEALVAASTDPNADVALTLTAVWDDSLALYAELDFNVQNLAMTETTEAMDADRYSSLSRQLSTNTPNDALYIVFTNLPSTRTAAGTLYDDDQLDSEVDTKTEYYIGSSSRNLVFDDIVFVPAENVDPHDTYVATFEVYDSRDNSLGTGTLTIDVGEEADIIWDMGGADSIQFIEDDFDEFYSTRTTTLGHVEFEMDFTPSRANGYIYYGGTASSNQLTVTAFERGEYYYQNTNSRYESLDQLYYVKGTSDDGYRVIHFTCYNENGRSGQDGVLVILLDGGSTSSSGKLDMVYNVKYNETLELSADDFYSWAGKDLSYITFDIDNAVRGEMTVGTGRNPDVLGDDLDDDTEFYYDPGSRDIGIDEIVYTPYSRSNSFTRYTDEISFTAYNSRGTKIKDGTLTICVVADSVPQVTISVDPGKSANFKVADFKTVASTAVKSSTGIDNIVLATLPKTGTIYHGTGSTKAVANTTYSLGTSGTRLVSNLRYTATSTDGKYTCTYLAYDGNELLYFGEILFDVGDHAVSAGTMDATGAVLPTSSIYNAVKDVLSEELSYITVAKPSNAIVYYGYSAINSHSGATATSTKYYYKATGSQQSMSSLRVVPYADRTSNETIDVEVTCYDTKGNSTKVTVRYTYRLTSTTAFSDTVDTWYKDSVYFLNQNGIVNGVSSTQYGVGTNIKRGDFILMLYRAFNLGSLTTQTSSFVDVNSGDYYATAISTAKALGITNGYEVDGSYYFYPERSITREEAFALIYRTLNLSGVKSQLSGSLPSASSSSLNSFSDNGSVQSYARDAISVLVSAQIVKGSDGKINPANPISREEMAVILHRALTRY